MRMDGFFIKETVGATSGARRNLGGEGCGVADEKDSTIVGGRKTAFANKGSGFDDGVSGGRGEKVPRKEAINIDGLPRERKRVTVAPTDSACCLHS